MEKTCGNCGRVAGAHLECHIPSEKYVWVPKFTRPDSEPCEHWIEAKDTLEQRFQQLAKVARNMFGLLNYYSCVSPHPMSDGAMKAREQVSKFETMLEELGVIVDD